jgi:hypothetical protein
VGLLELQICERRRRKQSTTRSFVDRMLKSLPSSPIVERGHEISADEVAA